MKIIPNVRTMIKLKKIIKYLMEILVKVKYDKNNPETVEVITSINDCDRPEVSPTISVTPTSTPTSTLTATPTPTSTLTKTPVLTATLTPTPTPTTTVTPTNSSLTPIQFTKQFYEGIAKGSIILESGKTYLVDYIKNTVVSGRLTITTTGKERANLIIGKPNYLMYTNTQSGNLLDLVNNSEVIINNVNFTQPPQIKATQPFAPSIFRSTQDSNAKWTVIVKDCDTTIFGENGGFGLGFLYGGISGNYAALINFKHAGPGLMDAKNPYAGSVMYITLDNVAADYKNPEKFGTNKLLVTGRVNSNNTFTITDGGQLEFLYNHYFTTDTGSNMSFLVHIGRFTFMIDTINSVIDSYNCNLRPAPKTGENVVINRGRAFFIGKEPHAGDSFKINDVTYNIVQKNRTYVTDWTTWGDEFNKELAYQLECLTDVKLPSDGTYSIESYTSSFNLYDQIQPTYMIYKGNYDFRSYPTTKFEDGEILSGPVMGHQSYNHSTISLWARDAYLEGYYRQTDNGIGETLGFNMINCYGFSPEFNPPVPVTNDPTIPMPKRITDLLATLK